MNGVLASTCNRVFSETGGMSLSHPMGEGIHWRRAEFIGRMPRFFGAWSLLMSAPTMNRIVQARVHASASSLIV